MSKDKFRIIEEIKTNDLGNSTTSYHIQKKTWWGWKDYKIPYFRYISHIKYYIDYVVYYDNKETITQLLGEIQKNEPTITYKGLKLKKGWVSQRGWSEGNNLRVKWVELNSWGFPYKPYYYLYDLEEIKNKIDRNVITVTTRIFE
jgi:hypothetical protein